MAIWTYGSKRPVVRPFAGDRPPLHFHESRREFAGRPSETWMFLLIASLAAHLLILFWVAHMRVQPRPAPVQGIRVRAEIVAQYAAAPGVTVHLPGLAYAFSRDETAALSERLGSPAAPRWMPPDALDLAGLRLDLRPWDVTGRRRPIISALDLSKPIMLHADLAEGTLTDPPAEAIFNLLRREPLLLVVAHDETRSQRQTRPLVIAQMEQTFKELSSALIPEQRKRLRVAVVGFSDRPHVRLAPQKDLRTVRETLVRLRLDGDGRENVVKALEYCIAEFAAEGQRTAIFLVSDEQGDDVGVDRPAAASKEGALELMAKNLQHTRTEVYVFGREALFDTSAMPAASKDARETDGLVHRGLASARQETPPACEMLGIGRGIVTSGFGCYSLTMLACRSGGRFYILRDRPPLWNAETMADYEPDWCPPDEYARRAGENAVRRLVLDVVASAISGLPPMVLKCEADWDAQLEAWTEIEARLGEKIRWYATSIERMLRSFDKSGQDRHCPRRWEANFDLTLAMLYKMRFMAGQYLRTLQKLAEEGGFPRPADGGKQWVAVRIAPVASRAEGGKYVGGESEAAGLRNATLALQLVRTKHAGTPWAERARLELENLLPYRARWLTTLPSEAVVGPGGR